MITDETQAIERVVRMVTEGVVTAVDGTDVPLRADSICVHGRRRKGAAFRAENPRRAGSKGRCAEGAVIFYPISPAVGFRRICRGCSLSDFLWPERFSVKRPYFFKTACPEQCLGLPERAIHGIGAVRIGGNGHAGAAPFKLLQRPTGWIRCGSPAAADGAGIHLEDFARRNERIHRVKRPPLDSAGLFRQRSVPFRQTWSAGQNARRSARAARRQRI